MPSFPVHVPWEMLMANGIKGTSKKAGASMTTTRKEEKDAMGCRNERRWRRAKNADEKNTHTRAMHCRRSTSIHAGNE